jgi:FKBP-type peptidyl-prolyl cis-trans isomerase
MHYTGTIDESSETGEKGSKFDSSRDRGSTFDFQIGVGQVIKGWDEGIVGLCVGAKAKLIIPPEMGYGAQGAGGVIPGGATLNFDVEVVDISEG